ncbi:MAG: UPF0182 family protein [Thermoleophilia bacterium]
MDNVRPMRPRRPSSRRSTHRRVVIAAVVAVVVVLLALSGRLLGFYVDWLWFGEVGYRSVFWTRFWAQLLLGLAAAAVFFVILAVNVEVARRLAPSYRASADGELLEPRSAIIRRWVGLGGLGVSILAAVLAGVSASSQWQTFLLYLNQAPFGEKDPIFGHDVSFYVFSLPAWHAVQVYVFGALVAALILSAVVHLIMGGIEYKAGPAGARPAGTGAEAPSPFARAQRAAAPNLPPIDVNLSGRAVAHLSAILAAIFIVIGIGQLFRAWGLLYSTAGAIYGAAKTDVAIRLPLTRVTMVLAFAIAAVLIWNVWRRRQWWPAVIVAWVLALVVLRGIVPAAYQSLVVNPNQLAKEREYIAHNLKATKAAYALDRISQEALPPSAPLTVAKLDENAPTVRNIRLWDPDTLTTSYRQLQELRPYYVFLDADVDRYTVNGVYRQTMLSARELNIEGLPAQAQTWVNQHITYTHGFGVAMSAVNQVTSDGSPDFLVQDVPPRSVKGLEIQEPRIYYGERGTDYTLVRTQEQEFDYPGKSGDVYREYTGEGGIPISPLLARLAFSARFGEIKFFTTSSLGAESRIIIRNNISERIGAAAPFLTLDADPYMVIADGRLWWIQDAYTTTSRYPYAAPEGEFNYIRNSVKIVIDAYNGSMTFYAFDEEDPLLRAYRAAFPGLFTPMAEMPKAIMEHVRYPEGLFGIQASVYSTYHVDEPDVLYNKGDQWAIPSDVSMDGQGIPMPAFYVIMRLPGAENEEFLQMLPFVPNGRSNMISWLGARSDPPNYGKSVNILFSKSTTVVGPGQVEGFINQDPEISAQRSLWDQQGSEVILGNLLVVPVEAQLLYVQPLYLQSDQTQLPQLKRVIVFYRTPATEGQNDAQQVVAMAPTLGEALAKAFGGRLSGGTDGTGGTGGTSGGGTGGTTGGTTGGGVDAQAQELIARANAQFDAAQQALKAGDFAEYGRQVEALQQTLQDLQGLQ